MAGFVLSSLMGLISDILVSRAFGTNPELDAFYSANRLPEMLFNLMAAGVLASAFLPTFTDFLTRRDHDGAWRLTSAVANLVFITLGTVSLIC